jgi:hypothetical protein
MTRWTLLPLLALTSLIACGDKSDDDDDDDDGDVVTPQEGVWQSSEASVVSDTCGFDGGDDTGAEDDLVTITMTGDDTFTVVGSDVDMACALSGSSFSCDGGADVTDLSGEGLDAILTVATTFSGTLSSSTEGSMEGRIDATCEGADCETLSEIAEIPLPCEYVIQIDITYAG